MAKYQVQYYTVIVSKSRMFESYIIGYDYETSPPTPVYQNDVVIPLTRLAGDASSFTANGLEPNTAYYFLLTSCNRAGCSSTIFGPIITHKSLDVLGQVVSCKARYNPLTGKTRIWWDRNIASDHTLVICNRISSGTIPSSRFEIPGGLLYTEQTLANGWYYIVIQHCDENGRVLASSPSESCVLYVPKLSKVIDMLDSVPITDNTTDITISHDLPIWETLYFYDVYDSIGEAPVLLHLDDTFVLNDVIQSANSSVVCTIQSTLFFGDSMPIAQTPSQTIVIEDTTRLYDQVPASTSSTVTISYNDINRLIDTFRVNKSSDPVVGTESLDFHEGVYSPDPKQCVVTETVNTHHGAISIPAYVIHKSDEVFVHDGYDQHEINITTETEEIPFRDIDPEGPYGTHVGEIYNFGE